MATAPQITYGDATYASHGAFRAALKDYDIDGLAVPPPVVVAAATLEHEVGKENVANGGPVPTGACALGNAERA